MSKTAHRWDPVETWFETHDHPLWWRSHSSDAHLAVVPHHDAIPRTQVGPWRHRPPPEPGHPETVPPGVYRPRRPRASPLYRLIDRHFWELCLVWDERFAPTSGDWRGVIPKVVDRFLACGLLEHGFARMRCDARAHDYLFAFSYKSRYFRPSCHAKRLARWSRWLDETLLAPVPHRQVVLTIPERLRPYCLSRRSLIRRSNSAQRPRVRLAYQP